MSAFFRRYGLLLSAVLLLNACGVAYDLQQESLVRECDKLMNWSDRSTCIQQNKKSYDQYEKDRKNILIKGTEK